LEVAVKRSGALIVTKNLIAILRATFASLAKAQHMKNAQF
jgi:hypothetical protein